MFLYNFEENKNQFSSMAFETYVISALEQYLKAQGKNISKTLNSIEFDAVLPEGIDDIKGIVYLEIKFFNSTKNSYFQSIIKFIDQINCLEPGNFLLVLGSDFSEKSLLSMNELVKSKTDQNVYIWDLKTFNDKTEKFRQSNFEELKNTNIIVIDDAINRETTKDSENEVKTKLLETLKMKYQNEELTLFLGAGISIDAGVPLWDELGNNLLSQMIYSRLKKSKSTVYQLNKVIDLAYKNQSDSLITQMRYIRSAFDGFDYNKLVHKALYAKRPTSNTVLLNAIADICTPRRNHIGVQGIVTYNFDDLVERILKKRKVDTHTISSEEDYSLSDSLSIFHVHGYLPYRFHYTDEKLDLIFSEEDYHRVYRDAYCWSNIVQLNYLRENTCLFIGCSLTDPNLRRLLDVAARSNEKPRHFAIIRKPQILCDENVDNNHIQTYKTIDMNIKENCFAAMGINIIWIDDYSEIAHILKWLRN